ELDGDGTGSSSHRRVSAAGFRAYSAVARRPPWAGNQQNEQVTRRGLILFVSLGIAWGIPYLFIKVAVSELDPGMVVLARSGLAAILLLPLAFFRREVVRVVRRGSRCSST